MEYQWNMMERSLPLMIELSLSWMSVKVDMLREKPSSNAAWNLQVDHKFVENTTCLTHLVSLVTGHASDHRGLVLWK